MPYFPALLTASYPKAIFSEAPAPQTDGFYYLNYGARDATFVMLVACRAALMQATYRSLMVTLHCPQSM